jgi:hypothetical protein
MMETYGRSTRFGSGGLSCVRERTVAGRARPPGRASENGRYVEQTTLMRPILDAGRRRDAGRNRLRLPRLLVGSERRDPEREHDGDGGRAGADRAECVVCMVRA